MLRLKKLTAAFAALAILGGLVAIAMAADNVQQSVSIEVQAINSITVSGNPGNLVINSVPAEDTDNSTTYDVFTNSSADKKITAHLNLAITTTGLKLYITLASTAGTSAGEQEITTAVSGSAVSVVTDLAQESDTGKMITYKATATMSTPAGAPILRTVTLTIVDEA